MGLLPTLIAWSLSAAPILLLSLGGALEEGAPSLAAVGLCACSLLPWVALVGLPRGSVARAEPGPRGWLAGLTLGLPLVALALRLDLNEGRALAASAWTVGGGLALAVLVGEAARSPARTSGAGAGARRVHAALWWGVIAGPPLLALALSSVARGRGGAATWPAELAAQSPLGWLAGRILEPAAGGVPFGPLAAALLLLAAPRLVARAGGGAR